MQHRWYKIEVPTNFSGRYIKSDDIQLFFTIEYKTICYCFPPFGVAWGSKCDTQGKVTQRNKGKWNKTHNTNRDAFMAKLKERKRRHLLLYISYEKIEKKIEASWEWRLFLPLPSQRRYPPKHKNKDMIWQGFISFTRWYGVIADTIEILDGNNISFLPELYDNIYSIVLSEGIFYSSITIFQCSRK